jgi:5'-3' exonuclease
MKFIPVQPTDDKSPIQTVEGNLNEVSLSKGVTVNEIVVLFDGSPFLYIHGGNEFYERSLRSHIEGILLNLRTHHYLGFIDGRGNFRKEVAQVKAYKGNRTEMKKSIYDTFPYIDDVRETLVEDYGFVHVNGIEADDIVGILAQRLNKYPRIWGIVPTGEDTHEIVEMECTTYPCVIVSIDKDLLQLNCFHYDMKKHTFVMSNDTNSFIGLNKKRNKLIGTGYKFFYAQILVGDVVDNIPGLERCGAVRAYKILKDCNSREECQAAVIKAFEDKEQELYEKAVKTEQGVPILTEAELHDMAYEKYKENRHLVQILTCHRDIPDIQALRYPKQLFAPENSF